MATEVPSNKNIPATAAEVRDKMLKFKQGGPSVEEARQAMLSAREPATTIRTGTKIPRFVEEEAAKRNIQAPPQAANENARLILEAKNILSKYPLPAGKRYNLNAMRDKGLITQQHIDALLSEGKSVPESTEELINSITEPEIVETPELVQPTRVPAAVVVAAAVEPELKPVLEPEPTKTVLEDNKKFILSYGKEGKEWVMEMVFKNGAGTERWVANTREELLKQMGTAKANASYKIHEQQKDIGDLVVGDVPDGWDWFIEELKTSHGLTTEQFNALPQASKDTIRENIEFVEARKFVNSFPDFYACPKNDQLMTQYLASRGLSQSFRNLSIAYKTLRRQEILEQRPEAATPITQLQPAPAPVAVVQQVPVPESANSHPTVVADPVVPVPTVPTPVAPAPIVRKRVSTGIVPGSSSAAPVAVAEKPEEGTEPREFSEKELRTMPMADLTRIVKQTRKYARY